MLLAPMVLFGIGWAAMMGIPYAMVSKVIPEERRGVYMGIVNMMIVIPMLIQTVSFGPIIKNLMSNSAINAILFGGVFFVIAGLLAMRLNLPKDKQDSELDTEIPQWKTERGIDLKYCFRFNFNIKIGVYGITLKPWNAIPLPFH